jgi:hypothetical protein
VIVGDHDVPAFRIEIDAVSPPLLEGRPLFGGNTKERRRGVRLPAGQIDRRDRTPGLLEAEVILLEDRDPRAALCELRSRQQTDQSAADDDDLGLRHPITAPVSSSGLDRAPREAGSGRRHSAPAVSLGAVAELTARATLADGQETLPEEF